MRSIITKTGVSLMKGQLKLKKRRLGLGLVLMDGILIGDVEDLVVVEEEETVDMAAEAEAVIEIGTITEAGSMTEAGTMTEAETVTEIGTETETMTERDIGNREGTEEVKTDMEAETGTKTVIDLKGQEETEDRLYDHRGMTIVEDHRRLENKEGKGRLHEMTDTGTALLEGKLSKDTENQR